MSDSPLFGEFLMGGFECSTHKLASGRRLDMIAATRHDAFAGADYRRVDAIGMTTVRDGTRWHLIERAPGRYDFSSIRPMVRAAQEANVRIIWDLLHFGWPDHIEVFGPDFAERFGAYAFAFAELLHEEGVTDVWVAPVNEISFVSFAGGETGFFNPFAHGRGDELKRQLVRGALAAGRAVRSIHPGARLVHTDPVINVQPHPNRTRDGDAAAHHRRAQFHAWDMIAGATSPELGGTPGDLDVVGVNYYVHNQWYYPGGHGSLISPSSDDHRPLHQLILDVNARYSRPLFIAETGIEDEARAPWLAYVAAEARQALRMGADLQGVCLYPIVNHPGWNDDRHCYNGLWDYAGPGGERTADSALATEIQRQRMLMRSWHQLDPREDLPPDISRLDPVARAISEATETSREG
jgi:hypothetical protein